MPEQDPSSPWSQASAGSASSAGPTQPSHAWLSSETYAPPPVPPAAYPVAPAPVAPLVPAPVAPVEVHVNAPSSGRGLAILGVVLGGLALLGGIVPLFFVMAFGFLDDGSGGGYYGPVRGTIAPASAGASLAGSSLAAEITHKLEDEGAEPGDVTCPDTPKVAQDVTTVCHGTEYGDPAAFVVFFEDEKGSYTLLEA